MDFFDFVPVTTPTTRIADDMDVQEQIARIPVLENQRSALEAQAAAARSKKTKRSLAIQINNLTTQINDLKRIKRKADDEAAKREAETKPPTPAPTPGGAETDKVLQKPPVTVSETVKKDDVLSTAQPDSVKKKPNYLLWAGIGVGLLVVVGLVFASKKSTK